MIRLFFILLAVFGLTWLLGQVGMADGARATVALGFAVLAAHAFGLLLRPLGLPMVSAYLILGLLAGPQVLGLITHDAVEDLGLINGIALALIAMTAGGELVVSQIRPLMRSIVSITVAQMVIIAGGMALLLHFLREMLPFAAGADAGPMIAVCLLGGVLAVANSPATTIAVMTETESAGRFTDTVLGITVLKDVLLILLFGVVFALVEVLVEPEAPMALRDLGAIALGLGLSVLAGLGLAFALAPLLSRVGRQLPLLVVGVAILVAAAARPLGLDPLILCIAMGFAIRNFTERGRQLIRGVEHVSPLIYAVFFTMVGAGLDLGALRLMWFVATMLVLARGALTFAASWAGSRLVEDEPTVRRWGWTGFVAQAGVTLGLVLLVAERFPGWGDDFKTLIVAAVAVNQLVGPILFKIGLFRAGDVGRRAETQPV